MVESYFHILGIDHSASFYDIKRADRLKAKELHPDMNSAPDAHEQFVHLNEAYEFLLDNWAYIKPKKQLTQEEIRKEKEREKAYHEWLKQESLRIRKKAEEMSKMKFEEYKKTPIYRTTSILSSMADYFALVFGLFVVAGTIWSLIKIISQGFKAGTSLLAAVFTISLGAIIIFYTIYQIKKSKEEK